jgi:hypothetical protein
MARRFLPLLAFLLSLSSVLAGVSPPQEGPIHFTASSRPISFKVLAADPEVNERIAEAAERYRSVLARRWLGRELPPWKEPCPITVQIRKDIDRPGGATTFAFDEGSIQRHSMTVEGTLDQILTSALPHEIMHTITAHHFRRPVARWADEGVAVLAEDEVEQSRHEQLTWEILAKPGRAIPLRRLLALKEYPPDVLVLYAQGYSVTRFLVERKDRRTFLNFVGKGQEKDWDIAVCDCYGLASVEELEKLWVEWVKEQRKKREQEEPRRSPPPHGWTQVQVAELFQVEVRTIRRRWQSTCRNLYQLLGGQLPPL